MTAEGNERVWAAFQRWWPIALVGVVIIAGAVALWRTAGPAPAPKPGPAAPPIVGLARLGGSGDALLSAQADLFDPTPLFLPTAWNTSQQPLPADVSHPPGAIFPDYAPKLTYPEDTLALNLAPPVPVPAGPEALAAVAPDDAFWGFGRRDEAVPALASRSAYLEITSTVDGHRVLAQPLTALALPDAAGDWQPAEFLAAVSRAGLLEPPVLTSSSGNEGIDDYLQNYLAAVFRVGERLPPGTYRIAVGP